LIGSPLRWSATARLRLLAAWTGVLWNSRLRLVFGSDELDQGQMIVRAGVVVWFVVLGGLALWRRSSLTLAV
jgi:hypothetical protein